ADVNARALLTHPELDPVALMKAADEDRESLATLQRIIRISSIGESAARVLDLIRKGEEQERQDPDRIRVNIERLGGDPQQEYFAIAQLAESGEYAVPHLLAALVDKQRARIRPRIINALPLIGKGAVGPLVVALRVADNDVRLHLITALGKIGYAQAVPYLRRIQVDSTMPDESRSAAAAAVVRIERMIGREIPGSAEEGFLSLAEQYYNEDDSVRADPQLERANVWDWDQQGQALVRVVVPERIFGPVMAMRCSEAALQLRPDDTPTLAMWLAANIRRESRQGMDVESGDPDEVGSGDPTRPEAFPRALYFTQAAGPHAAHLVLERAVSDQDSAVALGAIAALRVTAGSASLIGTEDYKQPLVRALAFPDLLVRIRAALALGAALPVSGFAGADLVVPMLATAVGQTGREQLIVVDGDEANRNRVVGVLRASGHDAIGTDDFFVGMDRARTEFRSLSGVFIATDSAGPTVGEALGRLRGEFIHAKIPLVVLRSPSGSGAAESAWRLDPYAEAVAADAADDDLLAALDRVQVRTGQARFDEDVALSTALSAIETLRRIAASGRTVYDVGVAEPALIGALSSPVERVQTLSAAVLALIPTSTAQRSIAHLALDEENSDSLRIAAFASLAESARNHGLQLEEGQMATLVDIARQEADLVIRTAASRALGACDLKSNRVSEIIRSYHQE
ncbi:MAG: HEAT repeat domain-containing protein, partial [Phycisphaerae bacterium]